MTQYNAIHDWTHLFGILGFQRCAKSRGEESAIKKYIEPICGKPDSFGNYIKIVGENLDILWSSHTDTVHKKMKGKQRQKLFLDGPELFSNNKTCLGADCGAGMALMLSMIDHGINGVYVFHREEEIGGNGSAYIANEFPKWLTSIKACIAFDRYGFDSIITHQYSRCCSDSFADSLASELNKDSVFKYVKDTTGVFTDSANYVDCIGECTNISVGYLNHHTSDETLCLAHMDNLLTSLINLNPANLVYERNPGDFDYPEDQFNGWNDYKGYRDLNDLSETYPVCQNMIQMIVDYPASVKEILLELGIGETELSDLIFNVYAQSNFDRRETQ